MPDKYTATWVSHSSISDFLKCPRLYYLRNVYKDPQTGNKVSLMSPALALGQAVHEVVESLSVLPTQERFKKPLRNKLEQSWKKVTGDRGGFESDEREREYFSLAEDMLETVEQHPGPLQNLAVKIKKELPYYWLSTDEEIILCGKIDWLEYFPDSDSVHIIDFKTGKRRESEQSLQLPIYLLLAKNCQNRSVSKASYWYLRLDNNLEEQELPDEKKASAEVLKIAKEVKLARKLNRMKCAHDGCSYCEPYEKIVAGEAKKVGRNDFGQDLYVLSKNVVDQENEESIIL